MNFNRLLRDIKQKNYERRYKIHNRFIERDLYNQLKSQRYCDLCHEHFNEALYIHHKISVSNGGTNDQSNLMVVCYMCHKKLDKRVPDPFNPKKLFKWWH